MGWAMVFFEGSNVKLAYRISDNEEAFPID